MSRSNIQKWKIWKGDFETQLYVTALDLDFCGVLCPIFCLAKRQMEEQCLDGTSFLGGLVFLSGESFSAYFPSGALCIARTEAQADAINHPFKFTWWVILLRQKVGIFSIHTFPKKHQAFLSHHLWPPPPQQLVAVTFFSREVINHQHGLHPKNEDISL